MDANEVVSPDVAQQLVAAGKQFVIRYVSRQSTEQPGDITHDEALDILNAKLGLMVVQHVEFEGWHPTADLGTQYGTTAAAHAADIGLPSGVNVFLDLEGIASGTPAQSIIDYANNWSSAVSARGFVPGVYVGAGEMLDGDQLARLNFQNYWKSASTVPAVTGRGYQIIQSLTSQTYGFSRSPDDDVTQNDSQGGMAQWIRSS